jgi:hypothetical protein
MARWQLRPQDGKDPVLSAQPTDSGLQHWAELALEDGWDVAAICHCPDPDLQALVRGEQWYAVNMCGRCRRKVIITPATLAPDQ